MSLLTAIQAEADIIAVVDQEGHTPAPEYYYIDHEGKRYSFRSELTPAQEAAVMALLESPPVEEATFDTMTQEEKDALLKETLITSGVLDADGKVKKK